MTDSLHDSLLLTKLNHPRLSRDLVPRPRLLSRLKSPSSLVLVVAPAGYGKTTLVGSWLEATSMPSAWLALDESDNNFGNFVHYLIASIQTKFPLIGSGTINLLRTATSPSINSLRNNLLNELSTIDQEYILVLDDYHLIHNSAIHKLLAELLHNPPASLHLVLAARNDPPLPLPGLRARGLVTELRGADLRFTLDETTSLFRDVLRFKISDQEITALEASTEGWPVSLRLAAIHYRQSGPSGLIEASQRGGNRYLIDYLVSEVSAKLPEEVRNFLLKTSILENLCGPLCDAVMEFNRDPGRGQEQLEWLYNSEFFTLPIENAPGWYRYHPLFRQYLVTEIKRTLPCAEVAALHLRASAWFDSHGFLEKAIEHAFAAEDSKTAVDIFLQHRREITSRDDWLSLQRLLMMFPREVIDKQPEMRLAEASVLLFQAQHSRVAAILNDVESLLAKSRLTKSNRTRLEGEIAARRSAAAFWAGDVAQSSLLAQSAVKKLPPEWWQPREQAKMFLSVCLLIQGKLNKALEIQYNSVGPDFGAVYHARQLISTCFIHWMSADLPAIERTAHKILENYDDKKGPVEGVTWARHFLGIVYYHLNNFEKAEDYFSSLVTHPHQVHTLCYVNSAVALSLIYQFRGETDKAQALLETLLSFAVDTGNPSANNAAGALKAELAIRQGNLNAAVRWADTYQIPKTIRLPNFYASPLAYVQVLLAQNTPASRKKAGRTLAKLKKIFTAEHQTRWLISVLGLLSLLHLAEGDEKKALVELRKAVALAEPGGFIRLFVDLGKPVKPLLEKLMEEGASSTYIAGILSAMEIQESALAAGQGTKAESLSALRASYGVTRRELEVLQLLEKRYTDGEIAEALFISKETVHSHIAHLRDKLGVHGRRAIVQEARKLGLLG
jgi:LuxR family maltose regulon positive regulatory protein